MVGETDKKERWKKLKNTKLDRVREREWDRCNILNYPKFAKWLNDCLKVFFTLCHLILYFLLFLSFFSIYIDRVPYFHYLLKKLF